MSFLKVIWQYLRNYYRLIPVIGLIRFLIIPTFLEVNYLVYNLIG